MHEGQVQFGFENFQVFAVGNICPGAAGVDQQERTVVFAIGGGTQHAHNGRNDVNTIGRFNGMNASRQRSSLA
jgi:hypothetical protein